jgi:hypothetical protein
MLGLTTFPLSCADFLEILTASTSWYPALYQALIFVKSRMETCERMGCFKDGNELSAFIKFSEIFDELPDSQETVPLI